MPAVMEPPKKHVAADYISQILNLVKAKNPAEPEFHQAVLEVLESLRLVLDRHPEYQEAKILERITEPERVLMFRVPWFDDKGKVQVNRGFRIEMNSAIGPYKGGLVVEHLGPFQQFAFLDQRVEALAVDEMIVAAVDLARPHLARGDRHRQRNALVLGQQAARQRGLAGARGRRQHQHQPAPGDDFARPHAEEPANGSARSAAR